MFFRNNQDAEKVEFESLSLDLQNRFNSYQNFNYAVIGGLFLSLICSVLWAAVTVSTGMQIGFMAIGVGLLVGHGVKFFGAGFETRFGILGASLAFFACFLGNFLSQIGFIVNENGMTYLEVLAYLDFDLVRTIMKESFSGMDVFFYAFASYEGYKFSFRPIPEDYKESLDLAPVHDKRRLPAVGAVFITLSVILIYLSSSVNGDVTHYYPNGNVEYTGKIDKGVETGKWEYLYIDGGVRYYGEYKNGKEEGIWILNYESGKVNTISNYRNGLLDGSVVSYYESGATHDSSQFVMGRLQGSYVSYYESGKTMTTGNHKRDFQSGEWVSYYENGNISLKNAFEDGQISGISTTYDSLGNAIEIFETKEGKTKFMYQQDIAGNKTIVNGNGVYKTYYDNGQLKQIGNVKSGNRIDDWKVYHPNGKLFELASIIDNQYILKDAWHRNGDAMVTKGNGDYMVYYDTTDKIIEKCTYKDGKRHGLWKSFYIDNGQVQYETTYNNDLEDGNFYIYNTDGAVVTEGKFNKAKKSGTWIWYFDNGVTSSTVEYKDDKKMGKQIFYSELGYEAKEEVYKDGKLVSEKYLEDSSKE